MHRHDECHKLLNARVDGTSLLHLGDFCGNSFMVVAVSVTKSWVFEGRALSSFAPYAKGKNTWIRLPVALNLLGEPCIIYDRIGFINLTKPRHCIDNGAEVVVGKHPWLAMGHGKNVVLTH